MLGVRNFSSFGATARRSAGNRWKIEPNTTLSSSLASSTPMQ
uniref:Cytochrome P450 monooxygenase n=1 Tax=Rhizobium meliloti TaxID=382 RepID=I2E1L4_RHIML|nr:cytochrome P450 monooxygenase [Sinorhizobium meliloti]